MTITTCRTCGQEIFWVKTRLGAGSRMPLDAEPVWIRKEAGGKAYFLQNGEAVQGRITGDADDDPDTNFIEAYTPPKGHCPTGGRAPRKRQRRPSGYR
jgi:hypothetical protein